MNVLILGSGGREHCFGWKLSMADSVGRLFFAPGNPGTASLGRNLPINPLEFEAVKEAVVNHDIQLVVVGPEAPLVSGIVDFFQNDPLLSTVAIIGPDKQGAQLEGSKDFSKAFMQKYGIPTADAKTFTKENLHEGLDYLDKAKAPYVLKADGLAAGKGVIITNQVLEAKTELNLMLQGGKFGDAGNKVLIEEFMAGIEVSVFVLTDGTSYLILPEAKDYKRIGEGDTGLNTGGMGAISPVPFADETFMKKVENNIVKPTMKGLKNEGIVYKGFIFIGLMNCDGTPKVVEYNCRMGDPETEAVLPRIKNDLGDLLMATFRKELHTKQLEIEAQTTATVVMVSEGYPGDYRKGDNIQLDAVLNDSMVFHAGTSLNADGTLVTNGGRVLAITSFGNSISHAVSKSIETADAIRYQGKYYRRDIGQDLL